MNKIAHTLYISFFFLAGSLSLILLLQHGMEYYRLPLYERPYHEQHQLLKPSGIVGHGLGIAGTLMMITGVALYMLRKRNRFLMQFGYLKHWLELHIFLCSVGPLFVLFHTAFKFGGIVSISFWSMVAVVVSGVVGRFIYIQIPRSIKGNELTGEEIDMAWIALENTLKTGEGISEESKLLVQNHCAQTASVKNEKMLQSFLHIFRDWAAMRALLVKIRKETTLLPSQKRKDLLKAVKERLLLARRVAILRQMQKVFQYWHIFHLPFAITMFLIMVIHVAVTIIFGYRWIF